MEVAQWEEAPANGFTIADRDESRIEHRDLAEIGGEIIINRTKGNVSPFVPILKTPNYAKNSGNQTGYSVEVQDPESPTGYRTVCDHVSNGYLLIPNDEFFGLGQEIVDGSGYNARLTRIFWDGARFAAIWDFTDNALTETVDENDAIGLSLVMRNSYNKQWAAEACLMGKRFVCDNGVLTGEFFSRVRFKHTDQNADWRQLIGQGMGVLESAQDSLFDLASAMRRMRDTRTDHAFMGAVNKTVFSRLGPLTTGKVLSKFWADGDSSVYGLLNAGTNVLWHDKSFTASNFSNNQLLVDGLIGLVERTN